MYRMDAYTASSWRPPTRPAVASSILKPKKKQLKLAEAAKSVTLQTISENRPLRTPTPNIRQDDSAQLRREISALQQQCATLEAQRNDALEALDQVFSAPQPPASQYLAQISELKAQKKILEERCKTFSAWAEQQRLECSKHAADCQQHKQTCEQLNEALSEFYAKHSKLYAQHTELEAQLATLKASTANAPSGDLSTQGEAVSAEARGRTLEAENRAIAAEKTVQTLLGVRALVQSAPVALDLSTKTRSILESAIDVLNLANVPAIPGSVQACLTQVCSALANLGDEAAGHSITATSWLAKRDSVLRSCKA